MSRAILVFVALAIMATVGVYGFEAALENAGDDTTIVNESWTPTAGSATTLDESDREGAYYSNETTVYDENGTLMDRGTDYTWNQSNGSVTALSGGGLAGDSEAKITYSFQQTTQGQRGFAGMVGLIPRAVGMALPLGLVVILLVFLRGDG